MPLVYGRDAEVTAWVMRHLGGSHGKSLPPHPSIGYEREGELVAGVVFNMATETNLFAHIASSQTVLPPRLLVAVASYAFHQVKAKRMTFLVDDDNHKCRELVRGLGAAFEARIDQGHKNGDTLIYALWSDSAFHERLLASGRIDPTELTHG